MNRDLRSAAQAVVDAAKRTGYASLDAREAIQTLASALATQPAQEMSDERLIAALDIATDALDHYQHGGSEYRKIAAEALDKIAAIRNQGAR